MCKSKIPVKRLQGFVGHDSLQMTQLYVLQDEVRINEFRSQLDLLNEVDSSC